MLMKDSINATPWRNIPARCAKCLTIEASNKYENGIAFVEATWHIALDPDTFDKADSGLRVGFRADDPDCFRNKKRFRRFH
jgi:hypothetical protein